MLVPMWLQKHGQNTNITISSCAQKAVETPRSYDFFLNDNFFSRQ